MDPYQVLPPVLALFGAGPTELIIVLVILLILFGSRLPNVMRSLGQGITEFRKGVRDEVSGDSPESITHEDRE